MATPPHCGSTIELWITYHQASRKHKQVTAQLIDVGERSQLFDLEDVLDHIFQQDFVDTKWRSVVWWEDCTAARLKASDTVHGLLARGAGGTPGTALRLIIADTPAALWVHYEYARCARAAHSATQRIRLDLPHAKLERLGHVTNHIFAQGYLPSNLRSLVSWKGGCGRHVEESEKVEVLLSRGEGTCEEKPLRLVVGRSPVPIFIRSCCLLMEIRRSVISKPV
ncbi:hypothetical protein EDB83DRAFT_2338604 [Lactarius deliciosus]|nr:hypothetical protein EDB83DRAFT_2338604 [Lactarius deliciosus]